jgi:predicted ATPase
MGGWCQAEHGECSDGVAQLRQGLTRVEATGALAHRTYHLALLAEALCRQEQIEEGLDRLAVALAQMDGTGECFHAAELHRLQGELLLRQEPARAADREAEECFRRALTVARTQQAKSLELRAAMSLTRLYQQHNRQAEVVPMLTDCYGWFTEGFETPDLQEARALLDQIS